MNPLDEQVGGNHYKQFPIQPVEFVHKNKLGFIVGNVIKYVCRYQFKNGVEDLKKAKHNIDLLMELEYQKTDNKKVIYISGPMTGVYGHNFYEFYKNQYYLERLGWSVINPANLTFELAKKLNKDIEVILYEELLEFDLTFLNKADAIFMLCGWANSDGAKREYNEAKLKGLTFYFEDEGRPECK